MQHTQRRQWRARPSGRLSCCPPAGLLLVLLLALAVAACHGERPTHQVPPRAAPATKLRQPDEAPRAPSVKLSELAKTHKLLLVTHPVPHVLNSLVGMVDAKALPVEGLAVVGIKHARERGKRSYRRSRKLARRYPWLYLKTIRCPIGADDVFRENGCSKTFRSLVRHASGIIFTGGADIPPALYGQKTRLTTVIRTPLRQYWEISLLVHLLGSPRDPDLEPLLAQRPRLPVLGICMGMQALNVASGGTLHQDIPSDLYQVNTLEDTVALGPERWHRNPRWALNPTKEHRAGVFHGLKLEAAEPLWRELKAEGVQVVSAHHQSLDRLGRDLKVVATSTDGKVVEAVKHTRYPNVLGVQFHPEYFFLSPQRGFAVLTKDSPVSLAFHKAFWRRMAARLQSPK